jgi:hypothetical protein
MMTTRPREVIEGVQRQGEGERVIYTLDISEWGSNPTNVVIKVYDQDGTDVTSTVIPGSPTINLAHRWQ